LLRIIIIVITIIISASVFQTLSRVGDARLMNPNPVG